MKAEADRRLAAMGAKPATNGTDNQPAGAPAPRTPDGKFAAKDNTNGNPAKPDKPQVPSDAGAVDRSFLSDFDEEFRKAFEALPPESKDKALKVLTAEGRKERDYRQKTMSIAEREKALKEEEEVLRFGRAVKRDPKAFVEDYSRLTQRAPDNPAPAPFDHITATPEEFAAHEAEVRKQAADEAYDRFKRDQDAKEQAARELSDMTAAAVAAFVEPGDYEFKTVNEVYNALVADGVKFTKDNVVEKLKRWLPPAKAKEAPAVNPPTAASSGKSATGASSLARAGGMTPPVTTPPFIQSGQTPTTADEPSERAKRIQLAIWQVNKKREAQGKDLISLGSP